MTRVGFAISWFPLAAVLLVGAVVLSIVLAVVSRSARWLLALGAVLFVALVLGLLAVRAGAPRRLSTQTHPSLYGDTPPLVQIEPRTGRQVSVGHNNDVLLQEGDSSIVVDDNGVSIRGGDQPIHISRNGSVAMGQDTPRRRQTAPPRESDPSATPAPARGAPAVPPSGETLSPTVRPAPVAAADDEWIDAGQADFEADVYPSERSAAVAGSRQIVKSWDPVLPAGQEPTQVLVSGDRELDPRLVTAVIQTLRAKLGDSRVEIDKSSQEKATQQYDLLTDPYYGRNQGNAATSSAPAPLEADANVHLSIARKSSYERSDDPTSPETGVIELTLIGPAGKSTIATNFVNKPWVESGIDRAAQGAGEKRLVARSKRLCPTRSEAEREAAADAANKLIPLIRTAIERLEAAGSEPSPGIATIRQIRPDDAILDHVRAEMLCGAGVKDQFVQRLRKPYGVVWQQALLIDASDAQITRYAQSFLPQIIKERKAAAQLRWAWMRTGVGIILLTVLIAVVYAFLNAATRGYYTWLLRGSMVLAVLAGAVVLLLMA